MFLKIIRNRVFKEKTHNKRILFKKKKLFQGRVLKNKFFRKLMVDMHSLTPFSGIKVYIVRRC